MFSVIHGNKAEKEKNNLDLAIIYSKACNRASKEYFDDKSRENLIKSVYYWVKYLDLLYRLLYGEMKTIPTEQIQELFQMMEAVEELIKLLTPNELMRIFPITKRYDGERYQCKDYFTTMEVLKEHGLDAHIGEEVNCILWGYMNNHLERFTINLMCIVGELHKAQTGRDMLLDFFEDQGTPLTTYSMFTDPKTGKQYAMSNRGEVLKLHKPRPRYLKPVQGGVRR